MILTSLNIHLIAVRRGEWTMESRAAQGGPSMTEGPTQDPGHYTDYKPIFLKFYLAALVQLKIFQLQSPHSVVQKLFFC